jgi:hypothetical protein
LASLRFSPSREKPHVCEDQPCRHESIRALKQTIGDVIGGCSYLALMPMGGAKESDVRKTMFTRSATGKYQLTGPGGVWIDVTDE